MTCVIETKSKRHLPAMLAAGLAISALLPLGAFTASASADEFQTDIHGWDRNNDLGYGRWSGIDYVAPPPVAYSAPFTGTESKYPVPVFYGAGFGISLPGVNVGIQ